MAVQFTKATKKRARLRMNIEGQPGGGKTYSSILMAKFLIGEGFKLPENKTSRIFLIDTERSSAELFADEFDFQHYNLDIAAPKKYIEAIRAAEDEGAEVIIVDSITPEWKWCLSEVDRLKPNFGNNKWSAWSGVRPVHDDFLECIMGCRAHLIATTRAKPATVQDTENGKTRIVQVGMEAIQDDMVPFFFGIVMKMDADHNGIITKTRCRAIDGKVYPLPGESLAKEIRAWLDSGDPMIEVPHTLEDAIKAGVRAATTGATPEARKVAYENAKKVLMGWCKARGRSAEEAEGAQKELKERTTKALQDMRSHAAPAVDPGAAPAEPPALTNGVAPLSDEDRLRAIDGGRA